MLFRSSAVLTDTSAEGSASHVVNLLANASDVDASDVLSVTGVTYSVNGATTSGTAPAGVSLSGSSLTIDPTNAAFDSLAAGETKVIRVNYTVTDSKGGTVTTSETVTITGTNDAPTVTSSENKSVTESDSRISTDGELKFNDVDLTDSHTFVKIGRAHV